MIKNRRTFSKGDILTFKKPHPCGGFSWEVLKPGVDLKLECTTCSRVIIIPRIKVYKRLKQQ